MYPLHIILGKQLHHLFATERWTRERVYGLMYVSEFRTALLTLPAVATNPLPACDAKLHTDVALPPVPSAYFFACSNTASSAEAQLLTALS